MLGKLHSKIPEIIVALTGILGGLYLYYDSQKNEKELKFLEEKLRIFQNEQKEKDEEIFFENLFPRLKQQIAFSTETQKQIICICITGGPDNNRPSVITFLQERLKDFQYNVIVPPFIDQFTINQEYEIINKLPTKQKHQLLINQLMCQLQLLEHQKKLARNVKDKSSIILCNGGLLDILAFYKLEDQFFEDLEEQFQPLAQIRDKNYDAVIHLVTNADGLLQEYIVGGSQQQRDEKIQKAIETDKQLQKIWTGHPNHFLIDNRGINFDKKQQRAYKTVLKIIGLQTASIRWAKFEVIQIKIPRELFETTITLTDIFFEKEEQEGFIISKRVRVRQIEGGIKQYYLITTKKQEQDIKFERKFISYENSQVLIDQQKGKLKILKRKRLCLAFENQMMQLDLFESKNIAILRLAESDATEVIRIPGWLKIGKRVDQIQKYESFNLAEAAFEQQFQP